jgi:hypothetical protein
LFLAILKVNEAKCPHDRQTAFTLSIFSANAKSGTIVGNGFKKSFFSHLGATLHNRGATHMKNFRKFLTPLGVKTCGESEFEIFEAKNTFLIQRRPGY